MDLTREDLAAEDLQKICESKDLDHLGLVAGMYDELEIGEAAKVIVIRDQASVTPSGKSSAFLRSVKAMHLVGHCRIPYSRFSQTDVE